MSLGTGNKSSRDSVRTKFVEIGAWDMDAVVSVTVAHGIGDITKIRSVKAIIIPDANVVAPNYRYPIEVGDGSSDTDFQGHCWLLDTVVGVRRVTGGFFDSVDFDSGGSFNRGFVVIEYVR